jgi:hypothetical protein
MIKEIIGLQLFVHVITVQGAIISLLATSSKPAELVLSTANSTHSIVTA